MSIAKALEHYELATTHLAVALHLFTDHWPKGEGDKRLEALATQCAIFLGQVQPVLKELCDEGFHQMPQEALAVLANSDPRTFLKVSTEVRKEMGKDAD